MKMLNGKIGVLLDFFFINPNTSYKSLDATKTKNNQRANNRVPTNQKITNENK